MRELPKDDVFFTVQAIALAYEMREDADSFIEKNKTKSGQRELKRNIALKYEIGDAITFLLKDSKDLTDSERQQLQESLEDKLPDNITKLLL